ncbi:hypothetical protein CA13_17420 [Planctomycetes bacterium CA13]|uniref:Uncharacterized protein n=1 Tax=Novipirellula herctigrandis TaxID=2527986 RepID=A0A5C5YZ11_9BACT|nr:hypothetical protein CA13_17420 [Planctomycetes bacterium CA13]
MQITTKHFMIFAFITTITLTVNAKNPDTDPQPHEESGVVLVPTFHCIGIYWSPSEGSEERQVRVRYRRSGQQRWLAGLPLRYHPVDTPECKADYRGSLVNLAPGTTYDIELSLEQTGQRTECQGTTWTESFPVQSTVKVADRDATLGIDQSGSPGAYILYDGTGCTIDTDNQDDIGIAVQGSYVILRGFTIKNVKEHGIRIFSGHHIVIEDCDISKWGSESEKGWGKNYQACVFSNNEDLHNVIIQRCKLHHPSWDTNSWAEKHAESTHPRGPQTVVFWNSAGNHVIRYNECWSDENHYFNDAMGAGSNGGYRGFPGADSDIYCNYIANCWDDGIEAEGGDQNVRIWNNYAEQVLIPIANAAVSIGPLYVWRNVSGSSFSPPGSSWDMTHGPFIKMGYAGGENWMTGHMYFFNNTIFQKDNNGAGGLGGDSRIIKHCTTRNNILHVRQEDRRSIADNNRHVDNDFNHDLWSAAVPETHEAQGQMGIPQYAQGVGFDPETKMGMFQLAPQSKGIDAGVVIPNFCEAIDENQPDLGAHESGTPKMEFGVAAQFMGQTNLSIQQGVHQKDSSRAVKALGNIEATRSRPNTQPK